MNCEEQCDIDRGSVTTLVLCIILPTVFGIYFCIQLKFLLQYLGKKGLRFYRAYTILSISLVLMVWFGIMSWGVY